MPEMVLAHRRANSLDLSHNAIVALLNSALANPTGHPHVEQIILTTLVSLRPVMGSQPHIAYQVARRVLVGMLSPYEDQKRN